MAFLSDLLLASAAFGAAVYCFVLSRRLTALTRLDSGMGGAIALLSAQVDDLTRALAQARDTAGAGKDELEKLVARAEAAGQRLELLLATLHDLPDAGTSPAHAAAAGQPPGPPETAELGARPPFPSADQPARSEQRPATGTVAPADDDQQRRAIPRSRARIVRRRQTVEAL